MKPHKNYFTQIFHKFNIAPNECLAVGDNYEKDLEIPKELGCITISFGTDKRAHYQINDLEELLEILKRSLNNSIFTRGFSNFLLENFDFCKVL